MLNADIRGLLAHISVFFSNKKEDVKKKTEKFSEIFGNIRKN